MKILITQLGAIGDMILLTPMIGAIVDKYPDAEIHILSSILNYMVIENDPRISKIIVYEKTPLKFLKTMRSIRSEQYDYYIDPKDHYSSESVLFARVCRAKKKIGFNKPGGSAFDIGVQGDEENYELHFVARCFKPLELIGIEPPAELPRPELYAAPESEDYVTRFISDYRGKKKITVNISASRDDKMWQPEKWAELINNINRDEYSAFLSYAPSELAAAKEILAKSENLIEFKSRSMNDAISLIKASDKILTVDTSLVHVAAAFNKPILSLFNYNAKFYKKFYPLSDESFVVRSKRSNSVKNIEVSEVLAKLKTML